MSAICELCGFESPDLVGIQYHAKACHSGPDQPLLVCTLCGAGFDNSTLSVEHVLHRHEGKIAAEVIRRNRKEPGWKNDQDKPRWGLLPWEQVREVVEVMTFGAKKYTDDNWKRVPAAESRYFDAAVRHIEESRREAADPETGKSHLAHAVCCLLMLMWHQQNLPKLTRAGDS